MRSAVVDHHLVRYAGRVEGVAEGVDMLRQDHLVLSAEQPEDRTRVQHRQIKRRVGVRFVARHDDAVDRTPGDPILRP
jgi:hypothetical protein